MEFIDLKAQYQALQARIDAGLRKVLEHGRFIMGPEVAELEARLAEYVGRKYCVSCANGTDALQLVFMALEIGPGDAVFCPDVTFIASVEPARMLGAAPVFGDIDRIGYNLCPEDLERRIGAVAAEGRCRPRAVVAVDFLGNPAPYDRLAEVCARHGLVLIEDAAQSFGAEYRGRRCGAFGQWATTSFFPAKPLGCYGDGGAVFTDDQGAAELLRSLRVHGQGPGGKYDNVRVGLNSRLDTLQAAVLLPKLEALKEYELEARQRVARTYDRAFAGKFVTPAVAGDCRSAYAQYALLAEDRPQRDRLLGHLKSAGIPTMVYYPTPQHRLPVFQGAPGGAGGYPAADDYCGRTFSLPMHPYLSEADQEAVIGAALAGLQGR